MNSDKKYKMCGGSSRAVNECTNNRRKLNLWKESTETCQKYPVTIIFYYIFHIKPQFLKTLFQSQFLFDFDEIFTNRSENVRSFL
jgi:hypothetical protein